jgi:hypothetical protein
LNRKLEKKATAEAPRAQRKTPRISFYYFLLLGVCLGVLGA